MKRILFFLLLLLNLQITIEKGFWGITPGEVSAQRMRDDHITDPYIWGGLYYCDWCRQCCGDFQTYELHKKTCLFRPIECFFCGMTYFAFMPHICPNCIFCGFPLDKCICGGVQAFGKYGVELGDWKELKRVMAEAWYIFQLEMSTMTNAPTIIPNTPTNKPLKDSDSYPRVDMRMQKSLPDFKLIPNLPDHLHIQPEGTHECIPRAIAFMLELKKQKGFNYDKTFTDLKKIAENENYDLEKAGIPFVPPTRIENLYQKYNVTSWPLNESSIKNFIDKGMPVAIGVLKANPHSKENHMVTVIGYDTEYFYVAAGNVEGSANMIPIADIRDGDKRGKWFSSNLYYIE